MDTVYTRLQESARFIDSLISKRPEVGIVLGSGWQGFLQEVETPQEIRLSAIPHFLPSWARKRKGAVVIGKVSNVNVACLDARLHTYEGFTAQEVAYPIRTLGVLGVKTLFVTNTAGGINRTFPVGGLMLIKDHINMAGEDPTRGEEEVELGPRFVDMSQAYDPELIRLTELMAKGLGIRIKKGVYASVRGPAYETPAEVGMLRTLGADAVGMSTVPEVIAARQMGIRVCGISCITNKAAGLAKEKITHEEVLAVMNDVGIKAFKLLREIIVSSRRSCPRQIRRGEL
ncbi:MAG: purine-nucleoside phosphorylase [Candidatus Brocadiaceae bacterium]|nr:purine-nucleoside phosphorylase [Candidatus Brocadiaceae bacterium]